MNALAALPVGEYADRVLYSTPEPCFLCSVALRYSRVGTVLLRSPGSDVAWDRPDPSAQPAPGPALALQPGPARRPLQRLAAVLPLVSAVERNSGSVVECFSTAEPDALRLARTLAKSAADGLWTVPLVEAFGELWPELGEP